ncbi:MAG TPA: hypothetical protein VHG29_01995 [Novosphingobium sp.]|nr:hypothetical protein [Novosphingobium sp.]
MDLEDLVDQLRTLVGMIMEDVSEAALLRSDRIEKPGQLVRLKEASADIAALVDAAAVIERRRLAKAA